MDRLLPSQNPPAGLTPKEVPLFVTMGFDDNAHSGLANNINEGVTWASKFFASLTNPDGSRGSCSFYLTSKYITKEDADEPVELVKKSWQEAYKAGHDIGNHTHNHHWGQEFSQAQWAEEIALCHSELTALAIDAKDITGFRTPFLGYNDNTFKAVEAHGFTYDCSIEEGSDKEQDGTNFFWPYTLDEASPGNQNDHTKSDGEIPLVGSYPGLWEIPAHMVIAPPDEKCEEYGVEVGFRHRLDAYKYTTDPDNEFDVADGKITGLDYNCLVMFGMNASEWLGTLKYTLDLRLAGNRAPFTFGGHSDVYATGYDICPHITIAERREVIEAFFAYAQTKEPVQIVSVPHIIDWLKKPKALSSQ